MSESVIDSMANAMQDTFKKEVQKRTDVIRGLSGQEENLKSSIEKLNLQYSDLLKEYDSKKSEVDSIDYIIKQKTEEFEKSKSSSISALDEKEKSLNLDRSAHDQIVQSHQSDVIDFNHRKEHFENMKQALISELKQLTLDISEKITGAIEDINTI